MGVELFSGQARLTGTNEVTVQLADGAAVVLPTRFVLLCTGSHPHIPAIEGLSTDWCGPARQLGLGRRAIKPASQITSVGCANVPDTYPSPSATRMQAPARISS